MAKETQKQRILNDLKGGLYITPMDALKEHGCFRLAAVVCDLRKEGHNIIKKSNMVKLLLKLFYIFYGTFVPLVLLL